MKRLWPKLTIAFLLGYFVLLWINLHHLPIPWIDEVGYLDPAWNAWKNGTFASNLWPHQGADTQFMAHLPVLQWAHYLTFTLLPHSIWFTRLPLSILFLLGSLIWLKWLKFNGVSGFVLFLWALLFLCDRSVFEAARSMRMEVLELAFTGLAFWSIWKRRFGLLGLSIGLLAFTHPKVWAIGLVLGVFGFWVGSGSNRIRLLVAASLPLIGYLVQINGDVVGWYDQLVSHGSDHTIASIPGNRVWQHFVGRYQLYQPVSKTFTQYYHVQCYVPVTQWLALIVAIKQLVQYGRARFEPKLPLLALVYVINQVYWFAVVGPFQKYNMVVLAMGYSLFLMEASKLPVWEGVKAKWRLAILVLIPVIVAPVAMRHAGALVQWDARDTRQFNQWLFDRVDPNEKTLIVECASAWYESRHRPNVDFQFQFFLFNNRFSDYDRVIYITHDDLPFKKTATYEPPQRMKRYLGVSPGGVTHSGLHLYELNQTNFNSLIEDWRRK
jgi:hypothetical protein